MSNQYSDHKKPQINLEDYLPEVYRSDVNKTVSEMVLNRHFTKDDTTRVTGYIGKGSSTSALIYRQIPEQSSDTHDKAHRQAFQLTPTVYSKVGTTETALSFHNFLTQLELQGVDINRLPLWADSLEFNWVPPINIDMLANYQNYFWEASSVVDLPQYFTIENKCNKSTDKVVAYEALMDQRGIHFTIIDIDFVHNSFLLDGNWTHVFTLGFAFDTNTANTVMLADKFWTVVESSYLSGSNKTKVKVKEVIAPTSAPKVKNVGQWWYKIAENTLYVWDSTTWVIDNNINTAQISLSSLFPIIDSSFVDNTFTVNGRQDDLFLRNTVFLTKNSVVDNIRNRYWTVASVTFDEVKYNTTIHIMEPFAYHNEVAPSNPIEGDWWYQPSTRLLFTWDNTDWITTNQTIIAVISLAEILEIFKADVNCKCSHERGWDTGLWDDNSIGNLVWNTELLTKITHLTSEDWLAFNNDDLTMVDGGNPVPFALWFDTTSNKLKQYGDLIHPNPENSLFSPFWNPVVNNFMTILNRVTALENWDESLGCNPQILNQWSTANCWKHKTALTSYANVTRAQLPILEYDSNLELNEWTQVKRTWKYRKNIEDKFSVSTIGPNRIELEPIKGYYVEEYDGAWYIYLFDKLSTMNINIDFTDIFVPDYRFNIVDDDGFQQVYTVVSSEFRKMNTNSNPILQGNYFVTVIKLKELVFTAPMIGGPNQVRIAPTTTSKKDTWYGYHKHWMLDTTNDIHVPIASQQRNFDRINDIPVLYTPPVKSTNIETIMVGKTFQEVTIGTTIPTTINLVSTLIYNPVKPTYYATPNSNELRVYINNIRQYGTYTESIAVNHTNYTAIGYDTSPLGHISYVNAINFYPSAKLKHSDKVRIEVGPASFSDMGKMAIPVRTIEDDTIFDNLTKTLDQPIYKSLTEFQLNEQTKTELNQYPLFNVYNLITDDLVKVSPIITFTEDPDSPINVATNCRILTSFDNTEYQFDQHLLDSDDNLLYAYRDLSIIFAGRYWYSPIKNTVLYWDGIAWNNHIPMFTSLGVTFRIPVIQKTDPINLWDIDKSLWLNSNTNILYCRNTTTSSWEMINDVIVNDADPTFRTVWRHGLHNEKYIPQYVDKDRNPIQVGSVNGDWEVVKQWIYNTEHHNRSQIKLSQLITHFTTIINNQPSLEGLLNGGYSYSKIQSEYNYGVGGTIKEFNGAFDTLISAINITNTTPVGIIEFASNEYAANIRYIRDIFNRSIEESFSQYVQNPLISFHQFVINFVINSYENNDAFVRIYGDTSAYIHDTNTGIRNWIATAPMFGLIPAYRPYLIKDDGVLQLYHHDGHRSNIVYTIAEEDTIIRKVISLSDPRVPGSKLGAKRLSLLHPEIAVLPPSTESEFLEIYKGTDIRSGVYWYDTGTVKEFYRFEVYTVGPIHPSFYYNKVQIPDGTCYYNNREHRAYKKVGLTWVEASSELYDISPMWKVVEFDEILSELYLEIETRLYNACANILPVYDYTSLTPTLSEQRYYDEKLQKRFNEYVINFSVPTPYVNTQYRQLDSFTWNYVTSTILTPPHNYKRPNRSACWQQIYTDWYGTPYPHLEPWKLQGYIEKPTWWDTEYLQTDINSTRRWKFTYITPGPDSSSLGVGMWENIRIGVVPYGYPYPDGRISTGDPVFDNQSLRKYNYFCVNIKDEYMNEYHPDDLFPPYYVTDDIYVQSLFSSISQINAPDADYIFGDGSIIEWQWTISHQYPYDKPVIAYQMQPVKFLHATFGPRYTYVDELEVDTTFAQVYSHKDALFHGDMYNLNNIYTARGLNQWYVNFNRFAGFDTSQEFRELWVGWTPLLTYQFNGIIDTNTLDISTKYFDIIGQDYNIILANNGAIKDLWLDAFNIKILSIPQAIIQYNNQNKWKFEINSLANIARDISYYDVKSHPFTVNVDTNMCHAYHYIITSLDLQSNRYYVVGNETDTFTPGSQVIVNSNSTSYNFSVISSVYEPSINNTRINILEPIVDIEPNSIISIEGFQIPWSTGDMVILSSTKALPAPLVPNTPYYIINVFGSDTFQLAETFNEAHLNIAINFLSAGIGIFTIAEIISSFMVMGGESHSKELWYHYAIDKSVIRTITSPSTVVGMQNLINIVDGYAEYQKDSGIIYNTADSNDFDVETGRLINWQVETERFIDWAYGLRLARLSVNDRMEFSVNISDSTLTFSPDIPSWTNGTAIQITTTGSLPEPLIAGEVYYVYNTTTPGIIKLSASYDTSYEAFHIELLSQGSGHLYAAIKSSLIYYPQFEMNPNRNNIWLDTKQGVLANVIQGPYTDIRIRQTIIDQYGRALEQDKLMIYRQDERNHITIIPQLQNDIDPYYTNDPYNYLHLGGGHFFVEGYEHFLIFNPYTSTNVLIYDSFLGLNITRFEVDFFKKIDYTLRPTLGGYFLNGHNFIRNFEGSAADLHNFYDAYIGSEDSSSIRLSRSILGYTNKADYMELLNINSKSQFLFYRGMLHTKGSLASVEAYVNSRRFVSADVDECWATKLAEFGDCHVKSYPEILLNKSDGVVDDIRFEFIGIGDNLYNVDTQYAINNRGFNVVSFNDDSRWNNFPEQKTDIIQPLFLDAEIYDVARIFISPVAPPSTRYSEFDYWYNPITTDLKAWSGYDWDMSVHNKIRVSGGRVYWHHDTPCDDVRIIRRDASVEPKTVLIDHTNSVNDTIEAPNTFVIKGDLTYIIITNTAITITNNGTNNNSYVVQSSWYDHAMDVTYVAVNTSIPVDSVGGRLTFSFINFDNYVSTTFSPGISGAKKYNRINSEMVSLASSDFFDIVHIFSIMPAVQRINPAKLVNRNTNTVVSQLPLWHPAFNIHNYKAMYNISLINNQDPATYSNKISTTIANKFVWSFNEVGTIWFDSSQLGYIPYYDDKIYPDINDRLYNWGNLAPYGNVKVYEWVSSPVSPNEWDSVALKQQGDLSIPANQKITGTARKTIFKRTKVITTGTIDYDNSSYITLPDSMLKVGQLVYLTCNTILPVLLQNEQQYMISEASQTNPQYIRLEDSQTGSVALFDPPIIKAVEIVNIGTDSIPINTFQVEKELLENGDIITFSISPNGRSPMGSASVGINSVGYQGVIFKTPKIITETTGLVKNATVYTANIFVNGINHPITIVGTSGQTFTTLVSGITSDLSGTATAHLVEGNILITGANITDTIQIVDGTLFKSITDFEFINVISTTDRQYIVQELTNVEDTNTQTFTIKTLSGTNITMKRVGVGDLTLNCSVKTITVIPISSEGDWVKQEFARHRICGAMLNSITTTEPLLYWKSNINDLTWYSGDNVDIYLNGVFVTNSMVVYNSNYNRYEVSTTTSGIIVNPQDYIDIVRPIHTMTAADTQTDETVLEQYKEDYEYSQDTTVTDLSGNSNPEYYFWVESSTTKQSGSSVMSVLETQQALTSITDPYYIVQRPLNDLNPDEGYNIEVNKLPEFLRTTAIKYREAIVRNISNYINNNERHMVQFTRDLSLRNDVTTGITHDMLKNKHEEWLIFRQKQLNSIPENLWIKLTESLTGLLTDTTNPVPALNRVLYDTKYGTKTQYGLDIGQTFVDKTLGKNTVLGYLQEPNRDFSPISINDFFARNNFNTAASTLAAMNEIYDSFGSEHVNGIWFEVLQDALSNRPNFKDLMKTSWIALHTVRILEVNGMFDD